MLVNLRVTPFRKFGDIQFNSNAFSIYFKPNFKLFHTFYHQSNQDQKKPSYYNTNVEYILFSIKKYIGPHHACLS